MRKSVKGVDKVESKWPLVGIAREEIEADREMGLKMDKSVSER